jgi:ferredoxin like protein
MTVEKESIEELLGLDKFAVDEDNAHIELDKSICQECKEKPCLVVCPAKLYRLNDTGKITFDYAGCLECGTCRVVCKRKGIKKWQYPIGTLGVSFRHG